MEALADPETARKRVKYERPPIQEAICEIHFKLPQPLDTSALDMIRPHWLPKYPHQKVVEEHNLELHFAVDKMESTQKKAGHKIITRSEDGKDLAQLGPSFLAVNRLSPYLGWEERFRATILERFHEVLGLFRFESIERIGLRYINRIDLPQRPLRWRQWLTVVPPVPGTLQEAGGVFQYVHRQTLGHRLECQINFGSVLPSPEDVTTLLLDIDVIWRGTMPVGEVFEGLERVHLPHRELFEGYLLDKTRELFQVIHRT